MLHLNEAFFALGANPISNFADSIRSCRSDNGYYLRSKRRANRLLFLPLTIGENAQDQISDADLDKTLVFLTNNFTLPAMTIAQLYRCRCRWNSSSSGSNRTSESKVSTEQATMQSKLSLDRCIDICSGAIIKNVSNYSKSLYDSTDIERDYVWADVPLQNICFRQ